MTTQLPQTLLGPTAKSTENKHIRPSVRYPKMPVIALVSGPRNIVHKDPILVTEHKGALTSEKINLFFLTVVPAAIPARVRAGPLPWTKTVTVRGGTGTGGCAIKLRVYCGPRPST